MMYAPQVNEPQIPMNMMDRSSYSAPEVSTLAAPPIVVQESIPSTSVDTIRIKPKIPREIPILPPPPIPMLEEPAPSKKKKNKKIVRQAGGQSWEDPSLMEWEEGNNLQIELIYYIL